MFGAVRWSQVQRSGASGHHSSPVHPSLCRCLPRLYAPHEASLAPRLCEITEPVQPVPIGDALAHVA